MLSVFFRPASLRKTTQAAYWPGDFALLYTHAVPRQKFPRNLAGEIEQRLGIPRAIEFLAYADTLQLAFIGDRVESDGRMELAEVSAYTNWEQWK
jgi:hypothetical protein